MTAASDKAFAIVVAALRDCADSPGFVATVKRVSQELEGLGPDREVATHLRSVYASNAAPPWAIALLAGCNGHEAGYATARDILLTSPRESGAVYAGPAMAKIRGAEASADLVETLHSHDDLRAREGAAFGLALIRDRASIDAVVAALRAGRIGVDCAAPVLADLPLTDDELSSWLDTGEAAMVALALLVVGHRSARGPVPAALAKAALEKLEGAACPIAGSSWMNVLPDRVRI